MNRRTLLIGASALGLVAFGGGALVTWPVMTMIGATHSAMTALALIALAMLSLGGNKPSLPRRTAHT